MATYEVDYDQEELDAQVGGGFDPLPEGAYLFDIYEAEVKPYGPNSSQTGNRLAVTLKVAEGEYAGRQIWDNTIPLSPTWASGKPAFKFKQFFGALGLLEDGKLAFDPDDLLGEQVQAVLKVTPATEQYSAKNEVSRYLSASDATPVVVKEPVKKAAAKPATKPGKL